MAPTGARLVVLVAGPRDLCPGGIADSHPEVVKGLEDVRMASQQPGHQHRQQQHNGAQNDHNGNQPVPPFGRRTEVPAPSVMLRSGAVEAVYPFGLLGGSATSGSSSPAHRSERVPLPSVFLVGLRSSQGED
jgi:hypothetical protein